MATGRRLLAKTLGLVLGILLLTPAMSVLQATAAHADPGSEEAQFLAMTNQLRISHGLNALASYGGLVSIARYWSGNMANAGAISHNMNLPNEVSGPWTKLGENVGTGWTVKSIQDAFVASPHHYENLVDPVFNYVGIGVVDSGGKIYVTVDFMQLNNTPATAARDQLARQHGRGAEGADQEHLGHAGSLPRSVISVAVSFQLQCRYSCSDFYNCSDLVVRNSSMANFPSSRPWPDCLNPPKGAIGLKAPPLTST